MSSENEMTVLEMGDAESISLTDLLYLVQGDGADRDRKMTLTQLRDFLAEKFNTVKITGSVGGGAALGPTYATFASNSSTAQLTTISLDFSLSDGSRSAYIGTDEFKITNANIGVTEIKADGITTPKVTISGADVYLKVSEQNVLGVYYDYTDEETGSTVTVELATFGAEGVTAKTFIMDELSIENIMNASASGIGMLQNTTFKAAASFTGATTFNTATFTGTAKFNGETAHNGTAVFNGAVASNGTMTVEDLTVQGALAQQGYETLTKDVSFFIAKNTVDLTSMYQATLGQRVLVYNKNSIPIEITYRVGSNSETLPAFYAEEFILVEKNTSTQKAVFAPIRNPNS